MMSTLAGKALLLLAFAAWIYCLTVVHRKKREFYFFLAGSVGTFLLSRGVSRGQEKG